MSAAGTEGTLDLLLAKLGRAGATDRFRLVCLTTLDGAVLECSPSTLERAGLTQSDVVGRPLWTAMWWQASPETRDELQQAILQAANGAFIRRDFPAQVNQNGTETVLLDLTISPVRNEAGADTRLLIEARDIAPSDGEVVLAVRGTALLANDTRERYRQKIARITLDSMVQFVGLLDANGTVLEINHVALDAVGVKLSDVEGRPFWTTFWWQVSEEVNTTLRDSIRRARKSRCPT